MNAYILIALLAWVGLPAKNQAAWEREHFEPADAAETRLASVADDIVAAGGSPLTMLESAAVAYEESGLQRYVDDGTCNLRGQIRTLHWLELAHGTCDSGRSYTLWQLLARSPSQGELWLANRGDAAYHARVLWEAHPEQWTTWRAAKTRAGRWVAGHPLPVVAVR
jgi:hypothetical protein